jgi:hypothetical protein
MSAIIDLYKFQQSSGLNQHPHPRGEGLKGILEHHLRQEHQRQREQFIDRGAGTLIDGYDEEMIEEIVRYRWQKGMLTGDRQQRIVRSQTTESYLRTAVDFLLGHHMLFRSEARLGLELADILTRSFVERGPYTLLARAPKGIKEYEYGPYSYSHLANKPNIHIQFILFIFYVFYCFPGMPETVLRYYSFE